MVGSPRLGSCCDEDMVVGGVSVAGGAFRKARRRQSGWKRAKDVAVAGVELILVFFCGGGFVRQCLDGYIFLAGISCVFGYEFRSWVF